MVLSYNNHIFLIDNFYGYNNAKENKELLEILNTNIL